VRVALLSYRSKAHCGGQGVYVRHLSRELVRLGHEVEVFSGQPYPVLDDGVRLTEVPSLDLYREPDPFRTPRLSEYRDLIDVQEVATMWTAGFPEPRTFSRRVLRLLRERAAEFDVVHDNQTLGAALARLEGRVGLPLVATVHHPISIDRRIDLSSAPTRGRRLSLRRWYGFVRMQARVARRMRMILVPSESSRRDVVREFGVDVTRTRVVMLGVDDGFVPPTEPRIPGRILAMASADAPLKGVATLLEAFAKLRTERPGLELILVATPGGRTERLLDDLAVRDHVRFVHGIDDAELVRLMGSAEVACVPSLYEGFSLPTAELMATATSLVVSRAGGIPEVVGPDGFCADLVPPGDVGALALALGALLDDSERRVRYGAVGRRRVEELFSWRAVATATAAAYDEAIADFEKTRKTRAHR
jgi:glycosyltransferase involved in cell wall biosynthesis